MTELLKQPKEQILPLPEQTALLLAFQCDAYKDVPVKSISRFEASLLQHLHEAHASLIQAINSSKALDAETEAALRKAILDFAKNWEA